MSKDEPADAEAQGDAALSLARELRVRTQRERATARRLREYLEAARATTGPLPDDAPSPDELCALHAEVRIDVVEEGAALHLRVIGEVDVVAARRLQDEVDELLGSAAVPRVVLDLSGVSFFDSAGLSWLLHLRRRLVARDRTLVLTAPSRAVRRPLQVTGLHRLFQVDGEV